MKHIFQLFSGLKMTIVSGMFLGISAVFLLTGTTVPFDPAWITVLISGLPLAYLAIYRIIYEKGGQKISSALLITIAMVAAISIGELFAAGEVAFIMAIGAILEEKTVEKAKKGITQLLKIAPQQGRRISINKEELIPIEEVVVNDILRVFPGESIPVDGEIISGNTTVDQSVMTGESLPVDKTVGDSVYSGTINRFGIIEVKATKVGEDSSLQKMIKMVQDAENNKAPMQRIVDKWATWLVPIALAIAVITYAGTTDIVRAVTVLVVFCPCALVLATPTSIVAAIGQATKKGVIIKTGEALENMGNADIIAFDKTGTLTHGNLIVRDVVPFDTNTTKIDLLRLAATAESYSEHPLGKAIVSQAKDEEISFGQVENFEMVPGKGISANVDGEKVICGNWIYLRDNGIQIPQSASAGLNRFRQQGKASILVGRGKEYAGVITLTDTLRSTAKDVIREIKMFGMEIVLLTGDHKQTANYFAETLGIDNIYAELLPAEKVEKIKELQKGGRKVCMIGDGVNDAPALKTADIGVAMGSMGSDIAIEAADIALMGDDITKVPYLKQLSNATIKLIKINIALSMTINFIAIALSVLGVLGPITGALIHNAGSVLVVLNAASLYGRRFKVGKRKDNVLISWDNDDASSEPILVQKKHL
ncbi:cation-translocating P-type ATPase [Christensenellaceae bacterium OttesenSCG-928-K19]|nr:cation-translocating P-type ATPase [Christensenellaceae bacterium OttesenSCG-928-K19]